MGLVVTTEHAAIADVLDRFLAADPVRGTLLGSMRRRLTDTAWAAFDDAGLAVRSSDTHPVAVIGTWSDVRRRELAVALRTAPALAGVTGVPDTIAALVALLAPSSTVTIGQRLYRCDTLVAPRPVPGRAAEADGTRLELLRDWFERFEAEAGSFGGSARDAAERALQGGGCHLWLDPSGEPASLVVRQAGVAGSARIGPVYTPPAHRGHGYASAATAVATAAILAHGDVPVLFTDLANPTSNKIYADLGYRPVQDRLLVRF